MRPSSARQRSSRRFTLLLVLGAVAVLALALLFNRNGLLAISRLQQMQERESRSVDSLGRAVDSLRMETERLQNDSAFIEKAVREILGWGRPDEFVIRLITPRDTGSVN